MTHKHSSPIVVQAFAAPFARYPGYVISATRARDQHVIVIVLTRPASTDSRPVRKLAHAQHHAAPPKRRQHNVKNVTGRKIGVDRPWFYLTLNRAHIKRIFFHLVDIDIYCITPIFRVEEIFAIFANLDFARNFPPAKIISTANGISRNFPPAKFSYRITYAY